MSNMQGAPPPSPSWWSWLWDVAAWSAAWLDPMRGTVIPGISGALVSGLMERGLSFGGRVAVIISGILAYIHIGPVVAPAAGQIMATLVTSLTIGVIRPDPVPLAVSAHFLTGVVGMQVVRAVLEHVRVIRPKPPPAKG